jgi:hypothetical protein
MTLDKDFYHINGQGHKIIFVKFITEYNKVHKTRIKKKELHRKTDKLCNHLESFGQRCIL